MKPNAGCSRPRLVGLAIVTSLLSACATVSSEIVVAACPPVIEYSQAEQAQAADEVAALPKDSALIEWLADYSLLKEQARSCVFR